MLTNEQVNGWTNHSLGLFSANRRETKKSSAILKECKETRKEIANTLILFDTVYSYDGIVVDELNLEGDSICFL